MKNMLEKSRGFIHLDLLPNDSNHNLDIPKGEQWKGGSFDYLFLSRGGR